MGQTTSGLAWCCCGRDKRSSSVLNDGLQEKLLGDSEDHEVKTTNESPVTRSQSTSKRSSPRHVDTPGSGMMPLGVESEDDGSDVRMSRDRMDEEDDEESPRNAKALRVKKQLSSSYRPSTNEWDLARESAFGVESVDAQLEQFPSDRSLEELGRESVTRLARVTSDASNRDSYASGRDLLETTPEGDAEDDEQDPDDAEDGEANDAKDAAAQAAVLRRRPMPRPTSSRVFDDEVEVSRTSSNSSTARGLRELAEQDAESEDFGSYSSGSSSMKSFMQRLSDVDSSGMLLVESVDLTAEPANSDGGRSEDSKAPTSGGRSPRHSGSKKKGKKRR